MQNSDPSEFPTFNLVYSYETTLIEHEVVQAQGSTINNLPEQTPQ